MEHKLLNKKVDILKDGETIFTGMLKQSLTIEYFVVIDDQDDTNRLVIPKEDTSFIIEPFKRN
jgi:hypothetical protein